jgi:hypothetical protein
LHPSAIVLAFASAALVWKRGMRLHVTGACLAGALILLSLVPWWMQAARTPGIIPAGQGFLGRGLVTVVPVARGVLNWVRYDTLAVAGSTPLDFTRLVGPVTNRWMGPLVGGIVVGAGVVTFVPALLADIWFARRAWRRRRVLDLHQVSSRRWLEGYVVAIFAAAFLAFCLAPTTVMYWQGFVVLHAAVLPVVMWLGALTRLTRLTRSRRSAPISLGVGAMAASSIAVVLLMAAGSPHYRCGGREGLTLALKDDYDVIHDIGADDTCVVPLDREHGWAPDVLRESR